MAKRGTLSLVLIVLLTGCASTQQTIGVVAMSVGTATACIAIGDSMDGHPRGQPDVVTRRGDPNVGIPIAMAGAAVFIIGGIIFLTAPKHHDSVAH